MSRGVSGLADIIFRRWPQCHTYSRNPNPRFYQSAEVFPVIAPFKYVANLYAQMYPGQPTYGLDSAEKRLVALDLAMMDLVYNHSLIFGSIAFPYNMGCGLAGGDWKAYRSQIDKWSRSILGDREIHIVRKR